MCTAIAIKCPQPVFGRTLDLEKSYGEEIVVTPSGFSFCESKTKYSIIGIGLVKHGLPLYFDGMNEAGLWCAALNYPQFAFYGREKAGALNIPSYSLLPYILGNCASVEEAEKLLSEVNVTDLPFSPELKPTPLHWMLSDGNRTLVAEPDRRGLSIYDNDVGIMTNAPQFPYQRQRLCDYSGLSAAPRKNSICPDVELTSYSRGLGAMGLPGDFSSSSRFVKGFFTSKNTVSTDSPISDFFHIADSVSIPSGAVIAENGLPVRTVYTSCADPLTLSYYFTTYECRRIQSVRLSAETAHSLITFKMSGQEDIEALN